MTGISVTGGADGITARLDDLVAMSNLLRAGSLAVADARAELTAPTLVWELSSAPSFLGMVELQEALAGLAGPFGPLAEAEARLDTFAQRLRFVAQIYQHADDSVLTSITGAIGRVAWDVGLSIGLASGGKDARAGLELFGALPTVTDLAASATRPLDGPVAAALPDGHPVLHDLGPDESEISRAAPRTITDLMRALAWRNGGRDGEVSVSFVTGGDGARRAIVDIPGTKSWNPLPNRDITSVDTDVRALAGDDTSYEEGVFAALTAAGVSRDDQVMLVGHSEGGIVAVNAARDAVRSGRFRVTHVVTAGAPIGNVVRELPSSVQLLALENSADLVPECDGAANPDRPNVTTVVVSEQQYSVTGNHDLTESYEPAATAADQSHSASVDAFTGSAAGFLDGSSLQTHAYWITRGF
jgi:hypothetical protein